MRTRILSIKKVGRGGHEREVKIASPNCTIRCKPSDLESPETFQKAMSRTKNGLRPIGPAWGELEGHLTKGLAMKHFQKLLAQAERT